MPRVPLQVWCDQFPVLSETFVVNEVRALRALGHPVEVVALERPARPAVVPDVTARYLDRPSRADLAWLLARHPLAVAADRRAAARWRREEPVLALSRLAPAVRALAGEPQTRIHAHFAKGAALAALRASRILRRPWSLTAHAYDIYQAPANLPEKLRAAAVVTSGCGYTVRDLERIGGRPVLQVVMGVDPERFARTRPHPPGGTVIAVGRLVEKKGFVHLVRAAAAAHLVERVVIVGDGPQRAVLEAEIGRLGAPVQLAGELAPEAVRERLQEAALLAMPCVVAGDGDRDSMPVVVKEALALELPVVASDEVGLPELVRPAFGRLVAPGDHAALAAALDELLALAPEQRAAMGRAGRAHVLAHADLATETAKLSRALSA